MGVFLGPKVLILAQKSVLCYGTSNFVNGQFVALGKTAYFAPSDRFSTFRFGVTAVFVKKKSAETPTTYYSKYIFTNDHNSTKALPSLD